MGYFDLTDLESALSTQVVQSAYDDSHSQDLTTGAAASGVAACIAYGSAMCDSFMRNNLVNGPTGTTVALPLTDPVPAEVKFAALDFGIAYTMRRRPDVVRAMGEVSWTTFYQSAVDQMKRFCASQQRFPETIGTSATAGATIKGPDPEDATSPTPRWGPDWGDYT